MSEQREPYAAGLPAVPVLLDHLYSQRDPRWQDAYLGNSSTTIGGYGCLITAIAAGLADLGYDTDPARLNHLVAANNGYAGGNRLVFSVPGNLHGLSTTVIECGNIPAPVDDLAAALADGALVCVEVEFRPGRGGQHWVRLLDLAPDDGLIHDPYPYPSGVVSLMGRYARHGTPAQGGWSTTARAIYRAVIYSEDPSPLAALANAQHATPATDRSGSEFDRLARRHR